MNPPPRSWKRNLRQLDPDTLLKLAQGLALDPQGWPIYKLVALTPIVVGFGLEQDDIDQLLRLEKFRKHFLYLKVVVDHDESKDPSFQTSILKYVCVRMGIPFETRVKYHHEAGSIDDIPSNVWRLTFQILWPDREIDFEKFSHLHHLTISSNYTEVLEIRLPSLVEYLGVSDVCQLNVLTACSQLREIKLANVDRLDGIVSEQFPRLNRATFDQVSPEVVAQVVTIPTVRSVAINFWYDGDFPNNITEIHVNNGVGLDLGMEEVDLGNLLKKHRHRICSVSSDFAFLLLIPSSVRSLDIKGNTEVNFPVKLEKLKWDSPPDGLQFPSNLTHLHISKGPSKVPTFHDFVNLRLLSYTVSGLELAVIEAPNVRTIDLRDNKIKKFSVPVSTEKLNLEGNQMTCLPRMTHLTHLRSFVVLSPNLNVIDVDCPHLITLRVNGGNVERILAPELVQKLDYDNTKTLREVRLGARGKVGKLALSQYVKQVHSGKVAVDYHPDTTRVCLMLHGPCSPSYFIFPPKLDTLILHYYRFHQSLDLSRTQIKYMKLKVWGEIKHPVILPLLVEYLEIYCQSKRPPIEFTKPSQLKEVWIFDGPNSSCLQQKWHGRGFGDRRSYPHLRKINGDHPKLFMTSVGDRSCFIT